MAIILQSERLILRELSPKDAVDFYNLNADPEVIKYTGDQAFESINQAKVFLTNYSDYSKNGFGRWAVVHKETKAFLGWCGLKLNEEKQVDIGFRFFQKQWGKGYATEAAKACLDYGFETLNLKEIIARVAPENKASLSVIEKLNMTFWKNGNCQGILNSKYYKISKKTKAYL